MAVTVALLIRLSPLARRRSVCVRECVSELETNRKKGQVGKPPVHASMCEYARGC